MGHQNPHAQPKFDRRHRHERHKVKDPCEVSDNGIANAEQINLYDVDKRYLQLKQESVQLVIQNAGAFLQFFSGSCQWRLLDEFILDLDLLVDRVAKVER